MLADTAHPVSARPMRAAASLLHRLNWADLDPVYLQRLVAMARDEDLAGLGLRVKPIRTGDRSTAALPATKLRARADIVARTPLIVCGLPLVPLILRAYGGDANVRLHPGDGRAVAAGGLLATLRGNPRTLLAAERVILNFLQRLSGIATHTHRLATALGDGGTRLLDTRKTTPGHRMLEKYAFACGGGWNHRLGLFDRVMLKDNHLAVLGFASPECSKRAAHPSKSISQSAIRNPQFALAAAVAAARRAAPDLPVEVEVDRLAQIPPVLATGADVILLDNFTPARIRRAVALIAGRARTEASGGITEVNIGRYRGLGLDFVSTGAAIHHSVWADIGLDWRV